MGWILYGLTTTLLWIAGATAFAAGLCMGVEWVAGVW